MRRRLVRHALLAICAAAGCSGGTLDVSIVLKDATCSAVIGDSRLDLLSIRAVLKRPNNPNTRTQSDSCADVGRYKSTAELQRALSTAVLPLGPVAEEGIWEFCVVGTNRQCCSSQADASVSLWGYVPDISLPLPGNRLEVPTYCVLPDELLPDDLSNARQACFHMVNTYIGCGP